MTTFYHGAGVRCVQHRRWHQRLAGRDGKTCALQLAIELNHFFLKNNETMTKSQ